MFGKRKVATLVAEFLGTGILTLLVLSVQRSSIGVPFFVALIAGLTLMVMVFIFDDLRVGFLNPAITIGLWTARRVSTVRAILLVAMELLGAWVAYYVYTYFVHNNLSNIGGHYSGRTLAAEATAAGILGMVWAAAVFGKWNKGLKAPAVAVATIVAMIAASAAGIGLVNPALALGVRAWVWGTYVLGPVLGAIIGINLYGLLFAEGNPLGMSFQVMPNSASFKPVTDSTSSSAKKKSGSKSSKKR